jgi:antitoxin (DNA-binding transcriptional repressor) of toxin-antitoxin stability system
MYARFDLVTDYDQVDYVKAKIGELKAKLSRYIREAAQSGETIEICVREETVAYLVPTRTGEQSPEAEAETARLKERLAGAGLALSAFPTQRKARPRPSPAPDGDRDSDTVGQMRGEKSS